MPTAVQPDIELVIVNYLRANAALVALGAKVGAELPSSPSWPFLVVQQLGGTDSYPGWLTRPRVQIDCWADTKQKARDAAATTVAAMRDIVGTHGTAIITDSGPDVLPQWLPDPTITPARPRYVTSFLLTAHPAP